MQICVVHLLGEVMIAQDLIKLGKKANFTIRSRLVKGLFRIEKELRGIAGWHEIQLSVFVDAFGRSEPECFVANHGSSPCEVIAPSQEAGHGLPGRVGTSAGGVAMRGARGTGDGVRR